MNPFIKTLRHLVPEEIKALLEKIDSFSDTTDSSYYHAVEYVRKEKLTRLERFLLRDALNQIARRSAMVRAMNIVIHNTREPEQGYNIGTDLANSLYTSINSPGTWHDVTSRVYKEFDKVREATLTAEKEQTERKKIVIRRKPAGV